MVKIVFLDRDTIGPTVRMTRPSFAHEWVEYPRTDEAAVAERLHGASIAITNKVPLRAATLAQLPDLKMIMVAATGYDVIDTAACTARGIVVSNVRGYAVNTVPEHTMALMLALRRSLVPYRQSVQAGRWQEHGLYCFHDWPIGDLNASTLGIIGAGSLGRAVGRLGEAFGMKVLYAARKGDTSPAPSRVAFEKVLERSDVISLHCPLTAETRNLIALPEFRRMKRHPILINCGRGGLVNEADLVTALDEGLIAGAGIDCVSTEPPRPDNPLMGILDRPNVIVTPHVAWASHEAMQTLWEQTILHIENFMKGKPSNRVC